MNARRLIFFGNLILFIGLVAVTIWTLSASEVSGVAYEADIAKFESVKRAFLAIKMYSGEKRAWIYLQDENRIGQTEITVYDKNGTLITWPGKYEKKDSRIIELIGSGKNSELTVDDGLIRYRKVSIADKNCTLCHRDVRVGGVIGVMEFESAVLGEKPSYNLVISLLVLVLLDFAFILLLFFKGSFFSIDRFIKVDENKYQLSKYNNK